MNSLRKMQTLEMRLCVVIVFALVVCSLCASCQRMHDRRIEQFNRKYEVSDQKRLDVLWVGDSITEYWQDIGLDVWNQEYASMKCKNLGISGDTTQDVLRRLSTSNLDGLDAKVTVVLIGTNNLSVGVDSDEQIASQTQKIVQFILSKDPNTQVIVMGIFPRHWSPEDPIRARVTSVNKHLAKLDNGSNIHFLDIGNELVEPSGEISADVMSDALHLTENGYRIWADNLNPLMKKLLQAPSQSPK